MRYIEVIYGPTEDKHAMLIYGGDVWVELQPRKWIRFCDLPSTHPAVQLMAKGGLQAAIFIDGNGQQITRLNAYNEQHRALAAKEGLFINVPYSEDKKALLEQTIQKVLDELEQAVQLKELKILADSIEKRLKKLEETERSQEKQALWDSTVNETLSLTEALEKAVELSNMIFPTKYEQWAFQQSIKQAKHEAIIESLSEQSILANPELLKQLRQKLLAEN